MIRRRALLAANTATDINKPLIDIDNYLTIVALEDGLTASLSKNACEYCIDGNGNWLSLAAGTTTQSINTGQTLSFRGYLVPNYSGIGKFTINKKCNLAGNCMSLLFGDEAASNFSLKGKDYAFYQLFNWCSSIVEVCIGFLPATTLSYYCYDSMFYGCSNLTTAPELPATDLKSYCYTSMFRSCGLTTPPVLPATTLAQGCYLRMFYGCSKMSQAPALLAEVLFPNCYQWMFCECTKLNYIKMLATDISATNCLSNWASNVASTGIFVKNPDATWEVYGNSGIPNGWTVKFDGEEENNTFEFPIYLEIDEYDFNTGGGANGYINNSKSPDFYSNLYSYLIQILKTYGDAYIGGWNLPNILDYGIEIYVHKSTGWVLIEEIDYYESDNAIYGWCWSDYCEISFSNAAYIKWFDKL